MKKILLKSIVISTLLFYSSNVKAANIHNAEDFSNTGYKALNGDLLVGHSDCDLPEHTHREIVDIAVLLITGDLIQNYQIKKEKININKFN